MSIQIIPKSIIENIIFLFMNVKDTMIFISTNNMYRNLKIKTEKYIELIPCACENKNFFLLQKITNVLLQTDYYCDEKEWKVNSTINLLFSEHFLLLEWILKSGCSCREICSIFVDYHNFDPIIIKRHAGPQYMWLNDITKSINNKWDYDPIEFDLLSIPESYNYEEYDEVVNTYADILYDEAKKLFNIIFQDELIRLHIMIKLEYILNDKIYMSLVNIFENHYIDKYFVDDEYPKWITWKKNK